MSTLQEIESIQKSIEDEQDVLNQRVVSLKSMIAKYVERRQNGKNSS